MKLKNILLLLSLTMLVFNIQAQIQFAELPDIKAFLKTKTYVVEHEGPLSPFSKALKECMPKFWTITPYEFITPEEFETKRTIKTASFLFVSEAEITEDDVTTSYTIFNVVMGGSANVNKLRDLGSVPLSYSEADESSYLYKLGGILLFIQDHIKYTSENGTQKLSLIKKNSSADFKSKELWLLSDELPANMKTVAQIKKVCPFAVKIVTKDDIKKAIDDKNPKVIFLHKIGPEDAQTNGKCWKFMVLAQTGQVVYYDSHKVTAAEPDALLESDFKRMKK